MVGWDFLGLHGFTTLWSNIPAPSEMGFRAPDSADSREDLCSCLISKVGDEKNSGTSRLHQNFYLA